MLKNCKECPHYAFTIQIGGLILHHYCRYHELPYVFIKNYGKLDQCPPLTAKIEGSPQKGRV